MKDRESELKAREYDLDARERKLVEQTSELEHQRLKDQNNVGNSDVS